MRSWLHHLRFGLPFVSLALANVALPLAAEEPIVLTDEALPRAPRTFVPGGGRPLVPSRATLAQEAEELGAVQPASARRPAAVQVEPLQYFEVQPGVTKREELQDKWGPGKSVDDNRLSFQLEANRRVEVTIEKEVVQAIVIFLEQPLPSKDIAKQLDLTNNRSVIVRDKQGEALGESYPERGVLFVFGEGEAAKSIVQIALEPISAEPFVLRAAADREHRYERDLADLNYALQLDPKFSKAWALKGEILSAMGRGQEARTAAAEAVRLAPEVTTYRLGYARVLGEICRSHATGEFDADLEKAKQETARAIAEEDVPVHLKARGECQLAELMLLEQEPKYDLIVQQFAQATAVAVEGAKSEELTTRREAKRVLVATHLGTAKAIASGSWQKKNEVALRWLQNAAKFAEDLIGNEGEDDSLRFIVTCRTLEVMAISSDGFDPSGSAAAAIEGAESILKATDDSAYQAEIREKLGQALARAARVADSRRAYDAALPWASRAAAEWERAIESRTISTADNFELARLYFLGGSLWALHKKDHQQAIGWYAKAAAILSDPVPASKIQELGIAGEWMVSMGVSYWKVGRRKEAVDLTRAGMSRMETAVRSGTLPKKNLAVPYDNLSAMLRASGQNVEAERVARRMDQLDGPPANSGGTQRR